MKFSTSPLQDSTRFARTALTAGALALLLLGCGAKESEGRGQPTDSIVGDSSGTLSASERIDSGFRTVPSDTLTDQSGRRLALSSLRGYIWVADFIFTRCSGPCPLMSQKRAQLQQAFRDSDRVRFVSFSVDPEYDTPDRLARYASEYGALKEKWTFLTTGDKQRIWDLAMKGFALSAGEDTTRDGRGMIFHDERFVVVDSQGEIRGYVHTKDESWKDKVVSRIAELRRESGDNDAD